MATKKEEQIAWKKLCKAFPARYCTLELTYSRHTHSEPTVVYTAYVESGHLSGSYQTPIEAVNELIMKIGGSV
jgi:hypothetical protein